MESSNRYDAIVIGSGIGGMACANALAQRGNRVLLLEQHYVAGGMTHTFKRKKFQWDVGVHALGEMEEFRTPGKVLRWLSRGRIKMNMYDEIYDSFYYPDGDSFMLPSSQEGFEKNLLEKFPEEKEAIHKYMHLVKEVGKASKSHFMAKLLPRWADWFTRRVITRKFDKWAQKTTKEVLDELTGNHQLKTILAGQWGYYGAPPSESSFFIHAVTVRHFWGGGFYPAGSSVVIAEELTAPITENGGEVRVRTRVKDLIFEGDNTVIGVETDKGEKFYSNKVISAIGARATVERLLPENVKNQEWAREIAGLEQSPCHLCLYLGFEGDIVAAGATASNQWFFETWDNEYNTWNVAAGEKEAPVLYCSYPSLKDPDNKEKAANPTGEVVTFIPWDTFEKWNGSKVGRRGDDYKELKKEIEEMMFAQFAKHQPELAKMVVYRELSTPLSTVHYCEAPKGAIYGLMPTPKRFRSRSLRPKTPVKNFYLTGTDVGTAGVVGAMMGGVITASAIDKGIPQEFMK